MSTFFILFLQNNLSSCLNLMPIIILFVQTILLDRFINNVHQQFPVQSIAPQHTQKWPIFVPVIQIVATYQRINVQAKR